MRRKPTEDFEIGRYVTGTFDGMHYEVVILKLHWDEDAADDFQDCWIKENPEKFECHSSNAANDDMEEMDPLRKFLKRVIHPMLQTMIWKRCSPLRKFLKKTKRVIHTMLQTITWKRWSPLRRFLRKKKRYATLVQREKP